MTHSNNTGSDDNGAQKQNTQIPDAFKRLFQIVAKENGALNEEQLKTNEMSMKVTTRPDPFHTSVTLEVTCEQNKHIIVRMFDEGGKIIKMLSWYVMKGSNVTSINELSVLGSGEYFLDIIDTDGTILFNTTITKQ